VKTKISILNPPHPTNKINKPRNRNLCSDWL